jgi:hypothetical protein
MLHLVLHLQMLRLIPTAHFEMAGLWVFALQNSQIDSESKFTAAFDIIWTRHFN